MTINFCWSLVVVNRQGRSGNQDNMEARSGPIKQCPSLRWVCPSPLVCRPTGANCIRWRDQLKFGVPLGLTSQPAGGAGEDERSRTPPTCRTTTSRTCHFRRTSIETEVGLETEPQGKLDLSPITGAGALTKRGPTA